MASFNISLKSDLRREVAAELQSVLADLLDLSLQGKQAHWKLSGRSSRHSTLNWIRSSTTSGSGPTWLQSGLWHSALRPKARRAP